jgi:hypothetical protein
VRSAFPIELSASIVTTGAAVTTLSMRVYRRPGDHAGRRDVARDEEHRRVTSCSNAAAHELRGATPGRVAAHAVAHRDHDLRSERANDRDDVAQQRVARPQASTIESSVAGRSRTPA